MYKTMKRGIVYLGITSFTFALGIYGTRWKGYLDPPHSTPTIQSPLQEEWPLTKQLVSRSLQTHSFRSDKVRRNSDDEIVWRWLKLSIAAYPQNWVRLKISERESYGVVLYPIAVPEPGSFEYYNRQLKAKGLPVLERDKRYMRIHVYAGDIICPNWTGLIDVEEANLVFFEGGSA